MNNYARSLANLTGVIKFGDLVAGDTILIRLNGATNRAPHTLKKVERFGNDVKATFECGSRTTHSALIPAELIALVPAELVNR